MRNSSVSPGRESVHSRRTVPDLESGLCSDGSKADSASHAGTDSKGIPRWCRNSVPFLLACAIAAGLVYAALRFSPPDVRISASFGNGSGIVQPSSPSNGSDDTNDTRANVTTWVWTPPQAEPVCDRSQGCRGFEGWGSALAWNSIDLAGLDDGVKAEFMDAVWNRTNGLGLNVVRYSLAGGENPDPRHYRNSNVSHFQRNALLPGFQPSEGVWDWDADRGQRWMLTEAIKRGANLFEMVSSGPPYWMTVSNCSSGAVEPRNNNLRDDMCGLLALEFGSQQQIGTGC